MNSTSFRIHLYKFKKTAHKPKYLTEIRLPNDYNVIYSEYIRQQTEESLIKAGTILQNMFKSAIQVTIY